MKIAREYFPTQAQRDMAWKDRESYIFDVKYIDHCIDDDGTTYEIEGTEDFSAERLRKMCWRCVYTPNGKIDKGGHRRWDYELRIFAETTKLIRIIATQRMAGREFAIRQY